MTLDDFLPVGQPGDMSHNDDATEAASPFPQTSLTLFDRMLSDSEPESQAAIEDFFSRYWYPMYTFMRVRGESHDDASDLVQGFVMKELLKRDQIKLWDSKKGRLRTFLKVALDRYRMSEYRRESAAKRGGPKADTHISMDFEWAQGHYANTAIDHDSPDRIFEKSWAEATIQQVMSRLATQYESRGKLREFQLLCRNLSARAGDGDHVKYSEIADELQTSENNVKQKMLMFRREFQRTLEMVVAETTAEEDVADEVLMVSSLVMGNGKGD